VKIRCLGCTGDVPDNMYCSIVFFYWAVLLHVVVSRPVPRLGGFMEISFVSCYKRNVFYLS